jgi:hypothetical protein
MGTRRAVAPVSVDVTLEELLAAKATPIRRRGFVAGIDRPTRSDQRRSALRLLECYRAWGRPARAASLRVRDQRRPE